LIIEDNPVLSLKESNEIIKFLPIKTKNKDKISDKELLRIPEKSDSSAAIKQNNSLNNQIQHKTLTNLSKSIKIKENKDDDNYKKVNQIYQNMENIGGDNTNTPNIVDDIIGNSTPILAQKNINFIENISNSLGVLANRYSYNPNEKQAINEIKQTEENIDNILKHIEIEWQEEIKYIKENGFNGFSIKKLKETKIVSGHAELEGNLKKILIHI